MLYFRETRFFERSAEQHDEIINFLASRDMARSVAVLKSNWTCAFISLCGPCEIEYRFREVGYTEANS